MLNVSFGRRQGVLLSYTKFLDNKRKKKNYQTDGTIHESNSKCETVYEENPDQHILSEVNMGFS